MLGLKLNHVSKRGPSTLLKRLLLINKKIAMLIAVVHCWLLTTNVTEALRHKTAPTRLPIQKFLHVNSIWIIKSRYYWPIVRVIHFSPMDSHYKGPEIKNVFPFHDVITSCVKATWRPLDIQKQCFFPMTIYLCATEMWHNDDSCLQGISGCNTPVTCCLKWQR